MKKFIVVVFCLAIIIFITFNITEISDYLANKLSAKQQLVIEDKNEYAKEAGFLFVNLNEDYIPYSYQDLLNITYSVINNGWDSFTFYCPTEYKNCLDDMQEISKNELVLTHINNYVHPFNNFTVLNTSILTSGEITLNITHVYSDNQIQAINTEVDRLMNLLVKENNTDYENIKAIHDYIINNTKYDEQYESGDSPYASSIAYGTLFDHYATCNGYTDTMAIFLTKLGIPNYKIATTKEDISYSATGHVWNAVFTGGKWLHLDLTWDDPISDDGRNILLHKYFLVTTDELNEADSGEVTIEEHNFNKSIYLEFNEKSALLS